MRLLLQLFSNVAASCDDADGGSRMTSHNLAVIMAPNLLRIKPEQPKRSPLSPFVPRRNRASTNTLVSPPEKANMPCIL